MSDSTKTTWFEWARENTDPSRAAEKPEALSNLLVLDISRESMSGPVCSSILAEMGAEVIRIEPPGGDPARRFSPFGVLHRGTGLGYLVEGRNKSHITLNLEDPQGRQMFKSLAAHADVVIETFRPGLLDDWGIGYRQLEKMNERLIYAGLSTYGHFGPLASCGRAGSEISNQAYSGLAQINGEAEGDEQTEYGVPTKVGAWYGWYAEGLFGAYGILVALNFRETSGKGQFVDVSGAECIMKFIDYNINWYHMEGRIKERMGNYDQAVFPYTYIRCSDGYTFIAAYNDEAFATLMEIIGAPDLAATPRFSSFMNRTSIENEQALQQILEEWSAQYTVDEVIARVQEVISRKEGRAAAVVTGKVLRPSETIEQQDWWERGVFRKIEDPCYGELTLQGPVWNMSETPPRLKWVCRPVGADNRFIYLKYLGLGRSELERLGERGVI
ncbi:MAG: CoA transferase [Deltaproteobacteria bacterium]|nr:CoA transferase [Deltaproteobacteria bacterium]